VSAELELRALAEDDAAELHRVVEDNRAHLVPWMPWAAGQTRDGTIDFIRQTIRQEQADDGFQRALVVDGAIAGVIGHHRIDRDNLSTSIGYWLAERFEGQGLMTTAVRRIIAHAFDELGLHRVELRVSPDNTRSRALAERVGFREEGVLRGAERFADDDFRDLVVYSILRDDWEGR
jgi:ribosomal-protein-serine acetyltransferase